jgi:hypothetical protein
VRGAWRAGRAEGAGQETVCNQALAPAAIRAVEEGADLVSGSRNCGSGAGHGQLDPQLSRNFNHDASAAHGGDVGIRVGRQTGALQERRLSLAGESVANGRVAESHRHSLCARARDDARNIDNQIHARPPSPPQHRWHIHFQPFAVLPATCAWPARHQVSPLDATPSRVAANARSAPHPG